MLAGGKKPWPSPRRIRNALNSCPGALIQPSVYEGFGLPVIEAMACGCPIVASDIAPFREVTGGAAILAPPDDVPRFAAALREMETGHGRGKIVVRIP